MRRVGASSIAVLLTGLVCAGCGGGSSSPKAPSTITVRGDVKLTSGDSIARPLGSHECLGDSGYGDLAGGASVTVTDGSGKVIAVGSLGAGASSGSYSCIFPIAISNVPRADFYGIEVSHRGIVNYPLAQVLAGNVHLTIGD